MEDESAGVPIHRRTLEFEGFDLGESLRIVGRLTDVRPWAIEKRTMVHDMELIVEVRKRDLVITGAAAKMHTFPHAECPQIEEAFSGLVGLSIGRGYTKAVSERFVGVLGCSHLEHLARSLGPAAIQSLGSGWGYQKAHGTLGDALGGAVAGDGGAVAGGSRRPLGAPWLRNTCHIWAEGGIGEQKAALGALPSDDHYPVPPIEVLIRRREETARG